jgi:5,10-methylene-tetrahydrofolate dehydrogenase/methenyl tetrahydrofolate cyclohydrolase
MPQSNIKLCQSVIDAIKSDNLIKSKLAIALNRSYPTIQRYVNSNSNMLTTASALEVLRIELNKTNDELLNN